MQLVIKKHISDYKLQLAGKIYFDSPPGKPHLAKYYIYARHVDNKGYFLPQHLKKID